MRWLAGVGIVLTAYFPAAWWARQSYVDPTPPGIAVQVLRPFIHEGNSLWRVGEQPRPLVGDFILYENGHRYWAVVPN